eukprot:3626622-Amphidinium_carterae.1
MEREVGKLRDQQVWGGCSGGRPNTRRPIKLSLGRPAVRGTAKEAFDDVLRNVPVGAGLEGWRRLVLRYGPSTSQRKRVMLRSILNPGKASSVASLCSAMEKWEEQ